MNNYVYEPSINWKESRSHFFVFLSSIVVPGNGTFAYPIFPPPQSNKLCSERSLEEMLHNVNFKRLCSIPLPILNAPSQLRRQQTDSARRRNSIYLDLCQRMDPGRWAKYIDLNKKNTLTERCLPATGFWITRFLFLEVAILPKNSNNSTLARDLKLLSTPALPSKIALK